MPPAELAGVVALAIVVVREAFGMVRGVQARRNGTNGEQVMRMVQAEILRLRNQMEALTTEVATIKGRCDLLFQGRDPHP